MEIETADDMSLLQHRLSVLKPFTHLIEVKRDTSDARIRIVHEEIAAPDLIEHFRARDVEQIRKNPDQQPSPGPSDSTLRHNVLVLRLAVIGANIPDQANAHGTTIRKVSGLADAWNAYVQILTCMGLERSVPADAVKYAAFPPRKSLTPDEHYLEKCPRYRLTVNTFDVVWGFDSRGIVHGCIRFWDPQATRLALATIKDLWNHKDLAGHQMLLPTLSLFHVAPEMHHWLDKHIRGVVEGMRETGFHYNVNIREQIPLDARELGQRSAVLSGHASNLATNKQCWEGLRNLADAVIEECRRTKRLAGSTLNSDEWQSAQEYITYHASCHARNSAAMIHDVESWQQKAAIQIQAFFSLIAQRDATQSLELANASKRIAEASKKDSTSMKAIALVTMFFLPGTFLASLFAMPIFDWNAAQGQPVVNPRIWIYFVFAGPITLITICSWLVFNYVVGKDKSEPEKAKELSRQDKVKLSGLG